MESDPEFARNDDYAASEVSLTYLRYLTRQAANDALDEQSPVFRQAVASLKRIKALGQRAEKILSTEGKLAHRARDNKPPDQGELAARYPNPGKVA